LQSLIDATPDLMFFKDVHGVYLGCNAAFTEFIGRSAEEITGSTDEQIFDDPGVAAFFREQDRIMLEARASRRNEEWVEYPDGSGRLLETLKSPYYSADGRVLGLIGVSRDITEQHRARRELEAAKERAEAANQAKSNFLNNMGHELRTPLIPIVSMVDLLLEGDPGDREREYLELVRDSSQRLLSLINDLLEYSRLEKAEGGVDIQPLEPGRLLEAVRREIEPEAERKGLAVGVEVADGVPSAVMGDQAKIRKALSILAGNAVKFTDNGRVDLVARNGELDARPALVFEVRDTGIGLAPERAETLFQESFTQADDSLSRRYGGVGLGLSMAGRLAEIMDAELDVAGKEGRGSTFRLTVPLDSEG
jgi:PAS domain S-box-containing protein